MVDAFLQSWGLPAAGLLFAVYAWLAAWHSARSFDRKYHPKVR